ncbi:SLAIN motif-containing protein-like isoform X2 [Pleurodeles waltl]|uniref:SLAIN motif-containing protein-like isoform X2 n=1 Tax=Pleurodeles waltl TaxID=8319 RepID=UPI00370983DA
MVVPGGSPVIQPDHAVDADLVRGSKEASSLGPDIETDTADQEGSELEEVRKLQQLVRRLEIQNQQLRSRGKVRQTGPNAQGHISSNLDNQSSPLQGMEIINSLNTITEKREVQIMPDHHSKPSNRTEKENIGCVRTAVDAQPHYEEGLTNPKLLDNTELSSHYAKKGRAPSPERTSSSEFVDEVYLADFEQWARTSELTLTEGSEGPRNNLEDTSLDEVDLLELETCSEDEDCWLYVSPHKTCAAEQKPETPLQWCRQVLDHHSPETETACRNLISRIDQGYLSIHSALSSQSSVDSELSTSDDSISMGYKLQDLTDVQVMARLQEESLRQDYASSSASVSRRSSSASMHSLRRGAHSDQEFDTHSLEDEDDCDCSLSFRSSHRYSPSPLSSPRCQSPSSTGDFGKGPASRIRPPRRTAQNPAQDRTKVTSSEEELRHSLPNLSRTSLRSLDAVRNSRSLESDLQVPISRLTRMQQPATGITPNKLRYPATAVQPHLVTRQPMKVPSSTSSLLSSRQPLKSSGYGIPACTVRKVQAPPSLPPSSSSSTPPRATGATAGAKGSPLRTRTLAGAAATTPKSKLSLTSKRPPSSSRTSGAATDDSWKDGCY